MTVREPKVVRYELTLEGKAGADDTHIRTLKLILRRLLRSHSLRCTHVQQINLDDGDGR